MKSLRIAGSLSLALISFAISCRTLVRITDADKSIQKLYLQKKDGSPADSIEVKEGDRVVWKIKTEKVHAITGIGDKIAFTQPNFITHHTPHKKFLSKSWVLKVNRVAEDDFKDTGYVKEYYFISWKTNSLDSTNTYDPLIQIYPRGN